MSEASRPCTNIPCQRCDRRLFTRRERHNTTGLSALVSLLPTTVMDADTYTMSTRPSHAPTLIGLISIPSPAWDKHCQLEATADEINALIFAPKDNPCVIKFPVYRAMRDQLADAWNDAEAENKALLADPRQTGYKGILDFEYPNPWCDDEPGDYLPIQHGVPFPDELQQPNDDFEPVSTC